MDPIDQMYHIPNSGDVNIFDIQTESPMVLPQDSPAPIPVPIPDTPIMNQPAPKVKQPAKKVTPEATNIKQDTKVVPELSDINVKDAFLSIGTYNLSRMHIYGTVAILLLITIYILRRRWS
jgi:hypothetical protein